jgi:hypothetical protein
LHPRAVSQPEASKYGVHMKRLGYFCALATLAASCNALAVGDIAQLSIVDRETGAELVPHAFHGEYWVAGTPGAKYAIRIHNVLGERLLAVTSVDGVNVISGATAAWNQAGYVFDPYANYEVTGWRKSDTEIAAFTFTASPNSYAERTGRPANVGVIGVAVFRERREYAPPVMSQDRADEPSTRPASPHTDAPAPSPAAPAAPMSGGLASGTTSSARAASPTTSSPPALERAPKLGTGHGEREYSYVSLTNFTRMQPEPNEVIRIRYDSLANLIAMGVVEKPHPVVAGVNPFPASPPQYVPDPPGQFR